MPSFKLLLLQVGTILTVTRLVGLLFKRLHQPSVVGEMVAGILLGPSLLGWLALEWSARLFPPASLGYLNSLSQVGLLIFMFLVGLELDLGHLRELGRAAVMTSQVSIVAPFVMGFLFAIYLYPRLSGESKSFIGFALFMGSAMSVTAFPVLARILTERKMLRSRVGSVALACAAVDDVTAWCILAGIVVLVRSTGSELPIWLMVSGLAGFVLLMLFVVRRFLDRLTVRYENLGSLTRDTIAIVFLVVLASGLVSESLGVHALFGGFLAGVVPRAVSKMRSRSSCAAAADLFRAYRTAVEHFSDQRDQPMAVLCRHHRAGSGREIGRLAVVGSDEWNVVA